jgi:hypothetical protein
VKRSEKRAQVFDGDRTLACKLTARRSIGTKWKLLRSVRVGVERCFDARSMRGTNRDSVRKHRQPALIASSR